MDLACSALLFPVVIVGLGWPVARRLDLAPGERCCASIVLSLLGVYLLGFAVYLLALPTAALWALPALAIAGLVTGRRDLRATVGDPSVRVLLGSQVLVSAWSIVWLGTIASYSGGGWAGDWFEHWERLQFFRLHWPLDAKFLGFGHLTARPPLANLVTGALDPFPPSFAAYQILTALLNALIFLPAALLAERFRRAWPGGNDRPGSVAALLAVFLMVNPLFVQNATFAWTKLITGFFVLSGLYFFLRAHDSAPPRSAAPLAATSLAVGILAHYSAAPYALLLVPAWWVLGRRADRRPVFWRQTLVCTGIVVVLLATWFAWSLAHYGVQDTLLSNTSVNARDVRQGNQVAKIALNLRDSVVPHFARSLDESLIQQRSLWGFARDWLFQLYQLNLLFALGSLAWLVVLRELARAAKTATLAGRGFWGWFVAGAIFLGIAVHGARDHWGLTHICLQSLVILGLAFLASRWDLLTPAWRRLLLVGAAIDLVGGIVLNFAVQSYALDHWLRPELPPVDTLTSYSQSAVMNLGGKIHARLWFLHDLVPLPAALVLALLAAILTLALVRAGRRARRPA